MKNAAAAGGSVLEAVFPGRCLLCGTWLLGTGSGRLPVCAECRTSLRPIQGARCAMCGLPLVSEQGLCTRCRTSEFSFQKHESIFSYTGPVKTLLAALKFSGRSRAACIFAEFLSQRLEAEFPGLPVVPVPGRKRKDAVELIARAMNAGRGIRVLRLLERTGGRPQKSLNLQQRQRNIGGRFRLCARAVRALGALPAEVVLLDDIFTTGATADACARVLRGAGCGRVSVLTAAMEE